MEEIPDDTFFVSGKIYFFVKIADIHSENKRERLKTNGKTFDNNNHNYNVNFNLFHRVL